MGKLDIQDLIDMAPDMREAMIEGGMSNDDFNDLIDFMEDLLAMAKN